MIEAEVEGVGSGIMLDGVAGLVRRGLDPEEALRVLGRGMRFAGRLVEEHDAQGWSTTTSGDLVVELLTASVVIEPDDPQLAAAIVEVARGMAHETVHIWRHVPEAAGEAADPA